MTDGEKILDIQKLSGLTWVDLAKKLGLASPQTFTDIRAGRHGISNKLSNKILEVYPNIRREWLLLGELPMTREEARGMVALYENADSLADGLTDTTERINVGSCFPKAELALRNTSDSMVEYPVGCILILKRVQDEKLLVPGCNYLVETNEFCLVKRIQKGADDNTIALYSSNTATYPDGRQIHEPFEIGIDSVRRVFSVLGYIYIQSSELNKV